MPEGRQRFKAVVPGQGQLWSAGSDSVTDDNQTGFDAEAVHAETRSQRIAGEVRSAAN